MSETYIPLSQINTYVFCSRRFYYESIEGHQVVNDHVEEGKIKHEHVHTAVTDRKKGNKTISRRQYLASDTLGISGYTDLVEEKDGVPYPVEFKKAGMGNWLNDQVQLCLQGLLLEEKTGISIPHGYIFYIGSKRRRKVLFDKELRETTRRYVAEARALLESRKIPKPVHDNRCNGCSVRPICLPDEVAYLDELDERPKRIKSALGIDNVLYVDEQGCAIKKTGERILVVRENEILRDVPLIHLGQVVISGNVNLTTPAMQTLLHAGIPVVFLSAYGRYHGALTPQVSRNSLLRTAGSEPRRNAWRRSAPACGVRRRERPDPVGADHRLLQRHRTGRRGHAAGARLSSLRHCAARGRRRTPGGRRSREPPTRSDRPAEHRRRARRDPRPYLRPALRPVQQRRLRSAGSGRGPVAGSAARSVRDQRVRMARGDPARAARDARRRGGTNRAEQLRARTGGAALSRRLCRFEVRHRGPDGRDAPGAARQRGSDFPDRARPDHEPVPGQRVRGVPAQHRCRLEPAPRRLPRRHEPARERGRGRTFHPSRIGGGREAGARAPESAAEGPLLRDRPHPRAGLPQARASRPVARRGTEQDFRLGASRSLRRAEPVTALSARRGPRGLRRFRRAGAGETADLRFRGGAACARAASAAARSGDSRPSSRRRSAG